MGLACLNMQIWVHQLMLQYKLMHQGHGAVVLSLIINGVNGSGQKSGNQKTQEMVPIILISCGVWDLRVQFESDNTSVVAAIQKGSVRDDTSMHLLRCLWFFVSHYDIDITIVHVAGVTNCTADHLSRHHMSLFFSQSTGGYHPYHTPSSSQEYCGITKPGLDFSKL